MNTSTSIKSVLLLTFLAVLISSAYGQNTFQKDYHNTHLREVVPTQDGNFAAAGHYNPDVPSEDQYVTLVKFSQFGDTIWTKSYGEGEDVLGRSLDETSDGGFILTGWTTDYETNSAKVYLIRTNSTGDTLWTKKIGGAIAGEEGWVVRQTNDGGFIIGGAARSFSPDYSDMYILKVDSQGIPEWSKLIGNGSWSICRSICQTADDGFAVLGNLGLSMLAVIKMNSNGDVGWGKTYGGFGQQTGWDIMETSSYGLAVVGSSTMNSVGGRDMFLFVTDSAGTLEWSRTYGSSETDDGYGFYQTADNGFVLVGKTTSFGTTWAPYSVRVNSVGDILWSWHYQSIWYGDLYSIYQTTDSGLIGVGSDNEIFKLDSTGSSGCSEASVVTIQSDPQTQVHEAQFSILDAFSEVKATSTYLPQGPNQTVICEFRETNVNEVAVDNFQIYPNPNNGQFTITSTLHQGDKIVEIVNMLGDIVFKKAFSNGSIKIELNDGSRGLYLARINLAGKLLTKKIVIE